jgi:hypothetical protein
LEVGCEVGSKGRHAGHVKNVAFSSRNVRRAHPLLILESKRQILKGLASKG